MKNYNLYYKIAGVNHITFDTLEEARMMAKHYKREDRYTSSINGAGNKIIRYNINTGKQNIFSI